MENLKVDGANLLKWKIGASSFLANPCEGARLMNWYLTFADGSVRDVIFWPESSPLGGANFAATRGGIPVLFPFAGNSFADGKRGVWKTPLGDLRPMKRHGYASDGKFELEMADDNGFCSKFIPSEEFIESYPFDCEFRVRYRFEELMLSCELSLFNRGTAAIPWGAGLHPYFVLPWKVGTERKNYRLLSDAKKAAYMRVDGSLAPAPLDDMSFGSSEMQNRILIKLKTAAVRFGPKNGEEDVCVQMGEDGIAEPGNCFVTWAEDEFVPYYCIEPWMSPPNSAGKPIHYVEAGDRKSFLVKIALA